MRVEISCKRCGLNRSINGRGACGACRAVFVYRPAERVRQIDCRGQTVFQWHADDRGADIVHVDNGETVTQERGIWLPVQRDFLLFPKVDRRRTARPVYSWDRRTY